MTTKPAAEAAIDLKRVQAAGTGMHKQAARVRLRGIFRVPGDATRPRICLAQGRLRQNIALALGLKFVFLVADDGAAMAVIANGLRLLSHRENV